jgi:hypothetical protein
VSQTSANIRDFGAVGDGVHDDGPAIRAAFDAIDPWGELILPLGIYRVASPLDLSAKAVTIVSKAAIIRPGPLLVKGRILTLGGELGTIRGHLEISAAYPTWHVRLDEDTTGLCLRNVVDFRAADVSVCNLRRGIEFAADNGACAYNRVGIRRLWCLQKYVFCSWNGGWANENTIVGGNWWCSSNVGNVATGFEYLRLANRNTGWRVLDASFQSFRGGRTVWANFAGGANSNILRGCRFETVDGVTAPIVCEQGTEDNLIDGGVLHHIRLDDRDGRNRLRTNRD